MFLALFFTGNYIVLGGFFSKYFISKKKAAGN